MTALYSTAIIAYITFNFTFAMVWNLGIFKKTYAALTGSATREKPIIHLGFAAIVIHAVSLAVLYSLFAPQINPLLEGSQFGLLVGAFSTVYGVLVVPAKFTITPVPKYVVLELAYGMIHFSIAGLIVAYSFTL